MKHFALALILVLAFGAVSQAQKREKTKTVKTEIIKEAKMVCPVTGEEADPEVSFVHKGTKYYFCCTGCIGKFKKNPDKFIKTSATNTFDNCDDPKEKEKKAESTKSGELKNSAKAVRYIATQDDGKAVINTGKDLSAQICNMGCPVMSKKVDPKVTTVSYNGKVYGFCCKSCINKFAATPEKYLHKPKTGLKVEGKKNEQKHS